MKNIAALFLVLFSILIIKPADVFAEGHERGDWYGGIGLGVGLGANFTIKDGATSSFNDAFSGADNKFTPTAVNLQIGRTLSDKVLLGLDITSMNQMAHYNSDGGTDMLQVSNALLMLTYFPFSEGLFVRLGAGYANFWVTSHINGAKLYGGYGALGGLGYALWLGQSFNLTINADYSVQEYVGSKGQPSSSNFGIAYIGFDWY